MTLICLIYQKGKQLINSPRTKIKKNINLNYKKTNKPTNNLYLKHEWCSLAGSVVIPELCCCYIYNMSLPNASWEMCLLLLSYVFPCLHFIARTTLKRLQNKFHFFGLQSLHHFSEVRLTF